MHNQVRQYHHLLMLQLSLHSLTQSQSLRFQLNLHSLSKIKWQVLKTSHHLLNSHLVVLLHRKQEITHSHRNLQIAILSPKTHLQTPTHSLKIRRLVVILSLKTITSHRNLKRLFHQHLTNNNNKIRRPSQFNNQLLILSLLQTIAIPWHRHLVSLHLHHHNNSLLQTIQ